MPEYSCYQNIFQKIIDKDIKQTIEYYHTIYKNQIVDNIKNDIDNIWLGFNVNSEKCGIKLYNEERDKLDFYEKYFEKLENYNFNIVYFIKEFNKIIKYLLSKYGGMTLHINLPFKLLPNHMNTHYTIF